MRPNSHGQYPKIKLDHVRDWRTSDNSTDPNGNIVGGPRPYVWIGDGTLCVAYFDAPAMERLIRQWEHATKKRSKRR